MPRVLIILALLALAGCAEGAQPEARAASEAQAALIQALPAATGLSGSLYLVAIHEDVEGPRDPERTSTTFRAGFGPFD